MRIPQPVFAPTGLLPVPPAPGVAGFVALPVENPAALVQPVDLYGGAAAAPGASDNLGPYVDLFFPSAGDVVELSVMDVDDLL